MRGKSKFKIKKMTVTGVILSLRGLWDIYELMITGSGKCGSGAWERESGLELLTRVILCVGMDLRRTVREEGTLSQPDAGAPPPWEGHCIPTFLQPPLVMCTCLTHSRFENACCKRALQSQAPRAMVTNPTNYNSVP